MAKMPLGCLVADRGFESPAQGFPWVRRPALLDGDAPRGGFLGANGAHQKSEISTDLQWHRIIGRCIAGGKTCHVLSACRKNRNETACSCRDVSTRTKRVPPGAVRLKSVTRTDVARVGQSHFSTSERSDPAAKLTLCRAVWVGCVLIWPASIAIASARAVSPNFADRTVPPIWPGARLICVMIIKLTERIALY